MPMAKRVNTRWTASLALAVIATLFLCGGLAAMFQELPWQLVGLAACTGLLALTASEPRHRPVHTLLLVLILVLGAAHAVDSLWQRETGVPFFNARFVERLLGAARHSSGKDKDIHKGIAATVSATPIDSSPPGEKAQSSAARKLSISRA